MAARSGARRRAGRAAARVLLAAAVLAPAAGEARPNVLLVSLDTVRADAIRMMPALRALADRGVRFTYALSAAPWTAPSHAALLTGRDPFALTCEPKRLDPIRAAPTLMRRLGAAGYEVAVITEMGIMTAKEGYADGTRHFWTGQRESAIPNVKHWRRASPAAPWLLVVHTQGAHAPYAPVDLPTPPRLAELWPPGFTNGWPPIYWQIFKGQMILTPAESRWLRERYWATARAADRDLARLLDLVEPWRADTLVIVTSDHGEELGEHGHWVRHGHSLHDVILRVPLVVAGPGVTPGVWSSVVSLLDVVPTLLDILDVEPEGALDGISLAPLLRGEELKARPVVSGAIQGNLGTQRVTYPDGRVVLGQSRCAAEMRRQAQARRQAAQGQLPPPAR